MEAAALGPPSWAVLAIAAVVIVVFVYIYANSNNRGLPLQGPPGSTGVRDDGNGRGQIREYGDDGYPTRDSGMIMGSETPITMIGVAHLAGGPQPMRIGTTGTCFPEISVQSYVFRDALPWPGITFDAGPLAKAAQEASS